MRGGKTATAVDNQWIKKKRSNTRSRKGRGEQLGEAVDGVWREWWRRTERRWSSGGFDVDQLWIWCFVCAAVMPRSGRKMRKAFFWKLLLSWCLPEAQTKTRSLYPQYRSEPWCSMTQREKDELKNDGTEHVGEKNRAQINFSTWHKLLW